MPTIKKINTLPRHILFGDAISGIIDLCFEECAEHMRHNTSVFAHGRVQEEIPFLLGLLNLGGWIEQEIRPPGDKFAEIKKSKSSS